MAGEIVGSGVRAVIAEANVTRIALWPWSFFGDTEATRTGFADTGFAMDPATVPEC
jgi:hypothetical protein